MLFNGDILRTIIEYDPDYKHKLVSKQFNHICYGLSTYMDVWNLKFDYNPLALDFIDRNILYIQKWGTEQDQRWYKSVMGSSILQIEDTGIDTDQPIPIDMEYLLSTCEVASFQYHFHNSIGNLDMYRLFFLIGANNNVMVLDYLINEGINIRETAFVGAITYGNVEILKTLRDYFTKKPQMILILSNTIESYAKKEVRDIINEMEILDAIIPNTIPLTIYNVNNKRFIQGLVFLKKELRDLNFNIVNTAIYFQGMTPFDGSHKDVIKLLAENRYYDYAFLIQIMKVCLEYSWLDTMEYLWINDYDNMPHDITRFIEKHGIYLNLNSLKWIESVYFLEQDNYKKIYKNSDVRDLKNCHVLFKKDYFNLIYKNKWQYLFLEVHVVRHHVYVQSHHQDIYV